MKPWILDIDCFSQLYKNSPNLKGLKTFTEELQKYKNVLCDQKV